MEKKKITNREKLRRMEQSFIDKDGSYLDSSDGPIKCKKTGKNKYLI